MLEVVRISKGGEDIPDAVGKWKAQLAPYLQRGEMLAADEREPSKRQLKSQRQAVKTQRNPSVSGVSLGSSTSTSPTTPLSNPSARPALGFTPVPDAIRPHEPRVLKVSAPFSAVPLRRNPPLPLSQVNAVASTPGMRSANPSSQGRTQPVPLTEDPDAVTISPELRDWMRKITIDMRFSPTRSRQMQEFIKVGFL